MHHTHIDHIAGLSSPVHSMDPRAKLITSLLFIFMVVLTPDGYFVSFGMYACLLSVVILVSRVPVMYVLIRSLTIMPFALAVSLFVPFMTPGPVLWHITIGPVDAQVTVTGLVRFASLGLRALLCFFATILLVSSTRFGDLMRAAGALGLPSKLVAVMSFMYRYLFIVIDETTHMKLARDLRSSGRNGLSMLHAAGGIVGSLFIRSFEHADRLYQAMLLRGYTGTLATPAIMRITVRDMVYSGIFLGVTILGIIAGRGLYA
ncbi:cobalt ECF transporter T component CbiQ [bacterium]|nr:cobalt ECF transporter T component CbiQ [bacterium]